MDSTIKFLALRHWRNIIWITKLEFRFKKGWLWAWSAKTGLAGFKNSLSQFLVGWSSLGFQNQPGWFPYFGTRLTPTQSRPIYGHGKLEDHVLEMFSTWTGPPLLYKWENHDRSRNPTFNHKNTSTTFTLTLSIYPCCSSHLSARIDGVLGGLRDPRATSLCHTPMGLLGRCLGVYRIKSGCWIGRVGLLGGLANLPCSCSR